MVGGIYELEIPWSQKNLSSFRWTLLGPCSIFSARGETPSLSLFLFSWLCYSIWGCVPLARHSSPTVAFLKRRLCVCKAVSFLGSPRQDSVECEGMDASSPHYPWRSWCSGPRLNLSFLLKPFLFIFIFDCAGSSLWCRLCLNCGKGGWSLVAALAAHCSGFSCCHRLQHIDLLGCNSGL